MPAEKSIVNNPGSSAERDRTRRLSCSFSRIFRYYCTPQFNNCSCRKHQATISWSSYCRPYIACRREAQNKLDSGFRATHLLVLVRRRIVPQMIPGAPGVGSELIAGEISDENWRREERGPAALAPASGRRRVTADRTTKTSTTNPCRSRREVLFIHPTVTARGTG